MHAGFVPKQDFPASSQANELTNAPPRPHTRHAPPPPPTQAVCATLATCIVYKLHAAKSQRSVKKSTVAHQLDDERLWRPVD